MAYDNALSGMLRYVMTKHISIKVTPGLGWTRREAKFHMEGEDVGAVLAYIEKTANCTREDALNLFAAERKTAMRSPAQENNRRFGFSLAVTVGVCLLLFCMFGMPFSDFTGAKVVVLPLLLCLLFFWVWNPRYREMETVWNNTGSKEKRLERLYEVQQLSLGKLILQRQRMQLVIYLVCLAAAMTQFVPAVVKVVQAGISAAQSRGNSGAYQQEMASLTVSEENEGTRYVVYNVDADYYTDTYLPEDQCAETAADVRAVLRIAKDAEKVGEYEDGGGAYKRYVTIELVCQRTGITVLTEKVYGGDPPNRVTTQNGVQSAGYGSRPAEDDIAEACARMITVFETETWKRSEVSQTEMRTLTASAENAGTRYIVYLDKVKMYTGEYIPEDKWARTAGDVRAVLRITEDEMAVGNYINNDPKYDLEPGTAYQYVVLIELVDLRTGSVALSETLYGGDPPLLSHVEGNSGKLADGYGSVPEGADIAAACERLITQFEASK